MRRLRGSAGADSTAGSPEGSPTHARALVIAGVLALVVLIGLVLVLTGNNEEEPAAETAGTTAPATTSAPSTSPSAAPTSGTAQSTPASNPADLPSALPAVALDGRADGGDGVSATLPKVEEIKGEGTGPGNIAGPAIRVTVEIHNGTDRTISVAEVTTNMYYGSEMTPASPLDDPSQAPFQGAVAPGGTAVGVYVFSVPSGARDSVTVEVGYKAGAPLLLFTGPVG